MLLVLRSVLDLIPSLSRVFACLDLHLLARSSGFGSPIPRVTGQYPSSKSFARGELPLIGSNG